MAGPPGPLKFQCTKNRHFRDLEQKSNYLLYFFPITPNGDESGHSNSFIESLQLYLYFR